MKVYVVAGSTQEYERWLGKGGTRFENVAVKMLRSPGVIRGLRPCDKLVLLPCWQAHPQWREIYDTMLATGRRGDR